MSVLHKPPPNKACTGRLGVCAVLGLVLNDNSFPFRELFLPQPPVTQAVGQIRYVGQK
jgi:hypothetical protein